MLDNPFKNNSLWSFRQAVFNSGYKPTLIDKNVNTILTTQERDGVIAVFVPQDTRSGYREYMPQRECPTLYRKFAYLYPLNPFEYVRQLEEYPNKLVDFLNQWGLVINETDWLHQINYDPQGSLFNAMRYMSQATELYDAYVAEDYDRAWRVTVELWDDEEPPTLDWIKKSLAYLITQGLKSNVTITLELDSKGQPEVTVGPKNLLGVMWLQLAHQFTGEKTYRKCAFCDTWFQVGVGDDASKATRLYCSDSCKFKAYRRRKKTQDSSK